MTKPPVVVRFWRENYDRKFGGKTGVMTEEFEVFNKGFWRKMRTFCRNFVQKIDLFSNVFRKLWELLAGKSIRSKTMSK